MPTLAEFLAANGADADAVKALTEGSFSGAVKRAFDTLQSKADAEAAARAAAEAGRKTAEDGAQALQDWYDNVATPEYKIMQNEVLRAKAEEARARAVVKTAQERGLIDVAAMAGYEPDPAKVAAAAAAAAPAIDPTKYMTRDEILQIADREGEAIALVQDIAAEHSKLFPDKPLNWRQLRKDAMAAKQPVEAYWTAKYGVAAAREARETADRAAYEARLRKEGGDAVRQQLVDEGFNPGLRAPLPSTNVFVPRKAADGSTRQPWDVPENQARQERLKRAMENEAKAVTH